MSHRIAHGFPRTIAAGLGLALVACPLAGASLTDRAEAAVPTVALSTSTTALAGMPVHTVTYRGVSTQVPKHWPVIDLDEHPGTCVRLDRPVVYLGAASAQQDCPANLVGRADTVWLGPVTGADSASGTSAPRTRAAGQDSRVRRNLTGASQDLDLSRSKVMVRTTWGSSPALTDAIVATTQQTSAADTSSTDVPPASPTATVPQPSASPAAYKLSSTVVAQPAASVAEPAAITPNVAAAVPPSSEKVLAGMGFDTCAAPTTTTMSKWRQSPYASLGIYIGGRLRACGDGNLSASWVRTVSEQGWGLVPIYVGLQAPCNTAGLRAFTATNAVQTANDSAVDAVARAKYFGLPAGTTIHYDMEYYPSGNTACTNAVNAFMHAWTTKIHSLGYRSGVYGNTVMMNDMANATKAGGFTPPDQIWYALWNYLQNITSSSFPSTMWTGATRQHQYRGDFAETWGGVTMHIDANYLYAPVAGNPVQTSYGTRGYGPGSYGFVFTGDMRYWRPSPGSGVQGKAYWTYNSGSTRESNGATWSAWVGPGTYAIDVNVPGDLGANGIARYTITDQGGTKTLALSQAGRSGYVRLSGTYTRTTNGWITLHLGDNDSTSKTTKIVADAARFVLVSGPPTAPTYASASAGDGVAVVSWRAATTGWPATSYTVTASPGGQSATVAASSNAALVTGLSNGTVYTFSVKANNAAGSSAARATSYPVMPLRGGPMGTVAPVRLLDTQYGTPMNPQRTPVPAGGSVLIKVAGVPGSPIPSGARSAALNITVAGAAGAGYLTTSGSASSVLNFGPGAAVANTALLTLMSDGRVMLTNRSSGPIRLIVDAQAQVTPGASGAKWTTVDSSRIYDTRSGTSANPRRGSLAAGESVKVRVASVSGSPVPAGSRNVAINLTATSPTSSGYLSVGGATSAVNFRAGQTVANVVMAPVASDGTVTLRNGSPGRVQVIVDVQGFSASSGSTTWRPVAPARIVDTRTGTQSNGHRTAVPAGGSITVRVTGTFGSNIPSSAKAVALNLTVTSPRAAGYLTMDDGSNASGSAVNFVAGQTVSNVSFVGVSPAASVRITNRSASSVHVIVDTQGFAAP